MKTDNELIAEFLDYRYECITVSKDKTMFRVKTSKDGQWESHTFENSWNLLMLVIERISQMHSDKFHYDPLEMAKGNFPKDDNYMDVICLPLSTSILEAYNKVVEFIKWHNELKLTLTS